MSSPGTYALLLRSDAPQRILVGALGLVNLSAGWYLYLGSARGPGGLMARLARHRRRTNKSFHWHVDYVRAATMLVEVWTSADKTQTECGWASAAAALPGAAVIAPRLGASDCGCVSHLFHYAHQPEVDEFKSLVRAELERERVAGNRGLLPEWE